MKGLLLLVLFLSGLGITFIILRTTTFRLSKTEVINSADLGNLPDNGALSQELSHNFDPTLHETVFKIAQIAQNENVVQLIPLWPKDFAKAGMFSSKIVCQDEIVVMDRGEGDREWVVSVEQLFEQIQAISFDEMLFSGMCNSPNCEEIVRKCKLYLY